MSNLSKSLLYDAVSLAILVLLALLTHGSARGLFGTLAVATALKLPYDAWEARRRDQNR